MNGSAIQRGGSAAATASARSQNFTMTGVDVLIVCVVLAVMAVYAAVFLDFSGYPFEDAAILMRYAQHFAAGHGIVWNVGEKPVDGATDFLFMAAVAAVAKFGVGVGAATRGLGVMAHILTVVLVYFSSRSVAGSPRWVAAASALFLAIGPGLGYVVGYFGTPFFVLFVAAMWHFALKIASGDEGRSSAVGFSASGLAAGLTRPEGVLLVGFVFLALLLSYGWSRARGAFVWCALLFGTLGVAYFLWHWSYFGYPLPNPFYKKGGGHLYWGSLLAAVKHSLILTFPVFFVFVYAVMNRETRRRALFCLLPIACFIAMWLLLSDEMNYLRRFQYPVVVMVILSWYWVAGEKVNRLRLRPAVAMVCAAVLLAVIVRWNLRFERLPAIRDGRYAAAMMLRQFRGHGYVIATTEAGLLPFYSEWNAVDTWGLNDQWIAHHGLITEDYLASRNPQVIMFHTSNLPHAASRSPWDDMTAVLQAYAREHGYVLAAEFGDAGPGRHFYYVSRDLADGPEIARQLRAMTYLWVDTNRPATNFAPHD